MTAPDLDPREQRVLELSAAGFTYERIARELGTGRPFTAKLASQLLRKLGAQSMPQAVLLACRAGLLDGRRQHHGDHNGYEAHIRRGDAICDRCRDGEKAYRAALKAAKSQGRPSEALEVPHPSAGPSAP